MQTCPYCHAETRQMKAGHTESRSQRYRCGHCQRRYTPDPTVHGYPDAVRREAVRLYLEGTNLRRIGRLLEVHHTTIMRWVKAHADQLPATPPQPDTTSVIEMDELFSFVGQKKRSIRHDTGG